MVRRDHAVTHDLRRHERQSEKGRAEGDGRGSGGSRDESGEGRLRVVQAVCERACIAAAVWTETGDAGRGGRVTSMYICRRGDAGEEAGGAGSRDTGEKLNVGFPRSVGGRRGFDEVDGAKDMVGHSGKDGADERDSGAAVMDSVWAAATAGAGATETEEEGGDEGVADDIA